VFYGSGLELRYKAKFLGYDLRMKFKAMCKSVHYDQYLIHVSRLTFRAMPLE
jgi:hypothetical protein